LIKEWDKDIRRGDIVSFRWHGAGPYGAGMPFLKQVIGLPGDVVTVDGRDMYVNGEKVSTAKEYSTRGVPLAVGMTGVIPEGRFYVHAPNPNSLDSRYLLTGWVPQEAVLGKAVLLF
jgi:conjugal transfer pilin signal peptidase TrbI